ncbi:amine-terminal region of A TM vesicle-mediated sorter, putative [Babesia ovata]|uniref:Amine-terminal region of A TM vesicle-mediated sorter, putative n=1 Tax=Babesia ovata TaxID=189622 RepID=A0A2H6KDY2_9APIC|nr:amine-terminal region of A TM vesicle-mediated sorter, putative [Babesia ovata]GBE61203.1 amine-terminal region of A TM vesicle-mediated sorter, putative [Babesia ovata]
MCVADDGLRHRNACLIGDTCYYVWCGRQHSIDNVREQDHLPAEQAARTLCGGGKVVLSGLTLKPSIVHYLGLPYHLTFGLIDRVDISIHLPLLSLSKRKLVIEVNNVVLLLTATPENQWDSEAFRDEYLVQKVSTLAAESLEQVVTEIKGRGFIWRTVISLLESLEIRINNVHVRIEDYTTNPKVAFALGCVVKSAVFLTSADSASTPRESQSFEAPFRRSYYNDNGLMSPGVIHRRIELEGVGVYIDRLDPLRPGMMHSSDALQRGSARRENPKARYPLMTHDSIVDDGEEGTFVDAMSYSGGVNAAYGSGGSHHRGVHFAHVAYRDRLRYSTGGRGQQLGKVFRIKRRRAGDRVRSRLLFARHSHDRVHNDNFGHQRPLRVLTSNNSVFSSAVSRVMSYLSTGEHSAECDEVSRNGWQRIPGRNLRRSQRRYVNTLTHNGSGNLKATAHDSRPAVKRDPRVSQRIIRRLANQEASSPSEDHKSSKIAACFGYGPNASGSSEHGHGRSDRRSTLRRLLCCDTSPNANTSSIDLDAPYMSPVGYNLSSGSTWRILLSTFCDIKHPTEEHHHESFDMIRESQKRYARRHVGHNSESPAKEYAEHVSTPSSASAKRSDSLGSATRSVAASEDAVSETTGDDAGSECSSSSSRGALGCFTNCGEASCAISDGDSDVFDAGAYNAEKAAPLSYDETWHTLNSVGASAVQGAYQQPAENSNDDDACMEPAESPQSDDDDGAASEAWTRYTFVISRDEDPSLKEFFLRSLEETAHNYIVNPKECNGCLSFYFCLYPTPPFVAPRTCWSAWGTEHYFKLYKETMALAKNYLPRCSVFLQLEDLNITISKDQVDCLINLIFESIMKYLTWQSGIVYTFENPRASPSDEILYMEYWPQYLLLDQNSKNNELKEFIMDFEILHSMQAIRILRSRASEGLRNLIRSFGERHGCSCDVSECLTDVLLVNICNQYDREADGDEADIDDCSRLQARLKIVGGIYEIASKHAKSHIFLESLRKICQPAMSTFDVVIDVVLTNTRVVFTYDVEPCDDSSSSAKAYVLSARGAHVFIADVYGRDGCQVIEAEFLPFSILSFPFSLPNGDAESQSRKGCPCRYLDGPATVLFSCGEELPAPEAPPEVEPELTGVAGGLEKLKALQRDFGLGALRRSNSADAVICDSNLYLGLSLNRYCKPSDADTRVLLHVNSDLFGHVRLLDEYMDCLRMMRRNKSLHDTLNPVLVGAEKKHHHLSHDSSGYYDVLYKLIDLGIEYSKNLLQGTMPFPNVDFFIEQNHQCVFVVDIGSSGNRAPYFVCLESFAMASAITPRLLEPHDDDSPFDSHIARMSNLRVLCVNGDYSFLSDGGSRQMYMGTGAGVKLSDYLNRVACAKSAKVRDDPVISLSMSTFQSNFELIRIGCENEIFVKWKCSNSGSLNRGTAKIVITSDLGSVHVSLRECDLLAFIDAYADYVALCNDCKEVLYPSKGRGHSRTKASHEKPNAATNDPQDGSPRPTDHNYEYVLSNSHDSLFRSIVSQKWNELQQVIAHRVLETSRMVQFEVKLDYLFFELRRLVRLDDGTINVLKSPGSNSGTSDFTTATTSPIRRTPSHSVLRIPTARPSNYARQERNSVGEMVIIPTEQASTYMSKGFSAGFDHPYILKGFDGMSPDSSPKSAISRHAALSCMQSALNRFGVTLPLLSCKLTGLGVKARCSSGVVDCLRAFVGCVEVEDQTNSVPLYLSTLFAAGDTTLFWRWLKVRREIHKVRSAMESYSDDLNASMRHLLLRSNRGASCSRTERDDPVLRKKLRHIDYQSIDFRHLLSHEYDEPQFFQLRERNSLICRAYRRVEQYLASIMDCTRTIDKDVLRSEAGYNVRLPCFMMASIDYDDCGRGKCKVDISNTMVNVAWEVVDELMDFCMRIAKKMANIPQSSAPAAESSPASMSLDTKVTVEQSNLNVLCDSAWVGYKNFVNFLWYKVLRDSFNSGDPGSGSCSRRCSIADVSEHRSHIYLGMNEHILQQRGIYPHSLGQGTNASISSDAFASHVKPLSFEKRREHHFRLIPKEQLFAPMKRLTGASNSSANTVRRWTFVHRLLHEVHRNAILSTPIYMRFSGRGQLYLSLSCGSPEPAELKESPSMSTVTGFERGFTDTTKGVSNGYPTLTVFMRASGSNIFGLFSRHFTYRVLTPCGYAMTALRKRAPASEEFYRQQIDFLKYIRQHRQRDSKFFELLALSKQTLYDFNECVDSRFIDPCRLEISGGVLLRPDSNVIGRQEFPQSVCMTVVFETVRCSLSSVDILSFCSLSGLASSCLALHTSDNTAPSTAVAAEPIRSSPTQVVAVPENVSNVKEPAEDSSTGADEFHSCATTTSGSDWVSVKSNTNSGNYVDIRDSVERKNSGLKKSGSRSSQASNIGFLERLLSSFSVGVKVAFNLVYVEVSSNYVNEVRNIFTASLEDFEFLLWSNREPKRSGLSFAPSLGSASNIGVPDGNDWVNAHFNESISLSEVYSSNIDDQISLCFGAIEHILSHKLSSEELHPQPERSNPSRLGFGVIDDPISQLSPSSDPTRPLLRFESHFCVTLDICKTSRREMVMEPVVVRFRGSKASMSSKTIASLSTSWINLNISLVGAECVFGFMRYISEMARLRIALVEQQQDDYHAFQPPVACRSDSNIMTTMMPISMLKNASQLNSSTDSHATLGLTNPSLPIWEISSAIAFRMDNNLFRCSKMLDLHECLLAAVRRVSSLKLEGDAACTSPLASQGLVPSHDMAGHDGSSRREITRDQQSYLINSLGQPIAVCLYVDSSFEGSEDCTWRIVEDGDSCILPVGHYGIILPFVVRIQLNNCIYEIPSSMLNLTQEDELMLRLDVSRKYLRGRHLNRMAFLRTMRPDRSNTQMYRFGVSTGCTRFLVSDFASTTKHLGRLPSRHVTGGWGQRVLKRIKDMRKVPGVPLHLFEHEEFKYAYVMVKTQQSAGGLSRSKASAAGNFSLQFSSTLWISNQSHENLVVFPSVSMDAANRVVPSSSLVWLALKPPATTTLPLAKKTIESNKMMAVVKAVGNNLFKQLAHIQDSKQAIKRIAPAHVLRPLNTNDDPANSLQDFRLQHILMRVYSYTQQRVSIPLSWTIEPSCTICVCLQDDFPLDVGGGEYAVQVNRAEHSSFEYPEDMPPHFKGDVLLSSTSVQHLYDSFELPRIKTPIPGYTSSVHLGNVGPDDILATGLNTGFVQDLTVSLKGRDTMRTKSITRSATAIVGSATANKTGSRVSAEDLLANATSSDSSARLDSNPGSSRNPSPSKLLSEHVNRHGSISSDTTPDDAVGVEGAVMKAPDVRVDSSRTVSERSNRITFSDGYNRRSAYAVTSKTFAQLAVYSDGNSGSPSNGMLLRRRSRVEHISSLRSHKIRSASADQRPMFEVPDDTDLPPKAILSATLIEVTSSMRSGFGTTVGRSGIRHYEISLESCQVVENMMPFDVYILSPVTYEYLKAANPSESDVAAGVPFYPVPIKASGSSQFSWYIKNGRFVLRELLSREFNLKIPTEAVSVSRLMFEAMQPKFADAFEALHDTAETEDSASTVTPTPCPLARRLVVSIEVSKKPLEPVDERGGLVKRYLASSQLVCTIFADKWIVNWLEYPISLCRGDGRYKQTIAAQNCTLVSQELSSTSLQLAVRKNTLKNISNFENYPMRSKRRLFSLDRSSETHVVSSSFSLPDLAYSTCDFPDTLECPKLHYLISTSMAPAPFYRTSVLEILPQTTVTNEFDHALWLREPDAPVIGGSIDQNRSTGYYLVEPGETVEFHSQVKGELILEITGVDPQSIFRSSRSSNAPDASSPFTIWSSGISLKPSTVVQLRFPASLHQPKKLPGRQNASTAGQPVPQEDAQRVAASQFVVPRPLRYGLCEVEIRMHRGAKMVRFMKPAVAEWVLLNTTGVDLWVQQLGAPGYGEVLPAVGLATDALTERYAGLGVPFACYDPFKEHTLLCRFHLNMRAFRMLVGQHAKGNRRKNDPSVGNVRADNSEGLLGVLPLRHVLNRRAGRVARVRGALRVNLSRVESMRCSAVFHLRYGNTIVSMRLIAQTCVAFGQKTLHFTAMRIPTRGLSRFQRIRPLQFLHLYSVLRDKLTVPHDLRYNRSGTLRLLSRTGGAIRKLLPGALCGDGQLSLLSFNTSRFMRRVRACFTAKSEREAVSETVVTPTTRTRTQRAGTFNWEYVLQMNILGLGTAICGGIAEELLYISSTLIKLQVMLDNDEHMFSLSVAWMQSDVHDSSTCYPTMFRPLATWHSPAHANEMKRRARSREHLGTGHEAGDERQQTEPHVITIKFNTRGNHYLSVREITNCSIELEPLSLNLDTRVGQALLMLVDEYISVFGFSGATSDYFATANVGIFSNVDSWLRGFDVVSYPLREVARSQFSTSLSSGTRYNISNLHVGRVTLAINVRRSGSRVSSDMQAQNVIIRYLMHIVRRMPHISDASIILAQESFMELCCTPYALMSHFVMRYITQSVQQIYKVLGAVDLIGNPKIVVHHWMNGCYQAMSIVRESVDYLHLPPVVVFLWCRSVSRMGMAVVSGMADAVYRLTGSWYLLFNRLSCNADRYAVILMQEAFSKSLDQPSNVMEGIAFGGRSVGRNLYVSVGNFALKPLHQLLRCMSAIKTAKGINGDVLMAFLHIFGSMISSMASLIFGTFSSLLSGISVVSQGLLHQIHSAPMLSAIRPQRSHNYLKTSGPLRYNFLESWSMCASGQAPNVKELLLLLPLDGKLKLFDPMYTATSHWSALSAHMALISPITVCTPASALQTFFWINRTHVGLLHRRKMLWKCESKSICSIEIFRVPATCYQKPEGVRYEDSVATIITAKVARKFFSAQDTFYLRVVHVSSESSPSIRRGPAAVPPPLLQRLQQEATFPSDDCGPSRLNGLHLGRTRAGGCGGDNPSAPMSRSDSGKSQTRMTSAQRLYQESVESGSSEFAGITIDKYERRMDDLPLLKSSAELERLSSQSSSGRNRMDEADGANGSWYETGLNTEPNSGCNSYERVARRSSARRATLASTTRMAKVTYLSGSRASHASARVSSMRIRSD